MSDVTTPETPVNDVTTPETTQEATPAGQDVTPTGQDVTSAGNVDAPGTAAPLSPAIPGRARRVILTALPAALVLATVGGAVAYTRAAVDTADRSVSTRLWQQPAKDERPGKDPAGDTARGRASTELSKLLLPVPSGYRLGPDVRELGNDGEQSGKKAAAAVKENAHGLAGKQRRAYEKQVDKLRIEGTAVRSYASDSNDLLVDTQIVRMKDKKAVRSLHNARVELFEAIGIFRQGPKIQGHTKNAKCFVPAKSDKDSVQSMECTAFDGELSISVSASGIRPFDRAAVAELLKDQLNHITSPGEYV
ncbi:MULTISPECIES: hypothetical protein [unclassified Streptomyces]|uniref:hypothetical protein n=1 Tax=unclassified Streptomyces TaxID=2593676 RepID=UPI0036E3BFB0